MQKLYILSTLVLVVFVSFLVSLSGLKAYYLEFLALGCVLFLALRRFGTGLGQRLINVAQSILFTFTILYVVLSTGGLQSPYFFFVYFLLFGLSLLLDPFVSLSTALAIVGLFLSQFSAGKSLSELLPVVALPFLVPFALYLGQEHRMLQKEHEVRTVEKEDAMLFVSTIMKGHLDELQKVVQGFTGDHDLHTMMRMIRRMKTLIDKYEKCTSV